MKKKRILNGIGALILLISAGLCLGWGDTWDEIRSATGNVKSVSAEFIQEKHMKILVQPLISTGIFHFQTPGSLRWEYRSPIQNILLMNNEGTARFVKTKNGWTQDAGAGLQGMQMVLEQITQWLSGEFENNPVFSARLEPDRKIVLTPREASVARMIQRVELLLSPTAGIMNAVIIYESDDSFTKLVFKNPVINQPIKPSIFQKVK